MIGFTKEPARLSGRCDDCGERINDREAVTLSGFSEKNHPMRSGQWLTLQLHEHCARTLAAEFARYLA